MTSICFFYKFINSWLQYGEFFLDVYSSSISHAPSYYREESSEVLNSRFHRYHEILKITKPTSYGLFGWRGEGGGVEGSRVV